MELQEYSPETKTWTTYSDEKSRIIPVSPLQVESSEGVGGLCARMLT